MSICSLGKMVVASGVTLEEKRKNFSIVSRKIWSRQLRGTYCSDSRRDLSRRIIRFWEGNDGIIREVYLNAC